VVVSGAGGGRLISREPVASAEHRLDRTGKLLTGGVSGGGGVGLKQ